jgi:hypothetical protein
MANKMPRVKAESATVTRIVLSIWSSLCIPLSNIYSQQFSANTNVRQFNESTKKRVKEVTATLSYFDLLVDNNRNKTIFSG